MSFRGSEATVGISRYNICFCTVFQALYQETATSAPLGPPRNDIEVWKRVPVSKQNDKLQFENQRYFLFYYFTVDTVNIDIWRKQS